MDEELGKGRSNVQFMWAYDESGLTKNSAKAVNDQFMWVYFASTANLDCAKFGVQLEEK